jgi:hypothetical protein
MGALATPHAEPFERAVLMSLILLIPLLVVLLVILTGALTFLFDDTWAGFLLSIISITISLYTAVHADKIRARLASYDARLDSAPILGRFATSFKKMRSYVQPDLSTALLALCLLCSAIFSAARLGAERLEQDGFLSFNQAKDGFVQIQWLLMGWTALPTFASVLFILGFQQGLRSAMAPFRSIVASVFVGISAAILPLSIINGGWSGADNYGFAARENKGLPADAWLVVPVVILASILFTLLSISFYIWICMRIGAWMHKRSERSLALK